MFRLAYLLEQRTGLRRIRCEYRGAGSDPHFSGWHVTWGDGPTKEEMRELVAQLADQVPGLDIAELRYSRSGSDLGEVVALLLYLDQHPGAGFVPFMGEIAFSATSYPERSDELWLRRARALLSIGRYDGQIALAERAARDWVSALEWLDSIAAADADPTIPKLAQSRARRLH